MRQSPASAQTERRRCTAQTKDGQLCRQFALPSLSTCATHDPERQERLQAARAKGGRKTGQLRLIRGKHRKLDTPAALLGFAGGVVQDALSGTVDVDTARVVLYGVSVMRPLCEAATLEERLATLEQQLSQVAPQPAAGQWRRY